MQDKIDIKDDKSKVKDETGKLGGDKPHELPKSDQGKLNDDVRSDKPA